MTPELFATEGKNNHYPNFTANTPYISSRDGVWERICPVPNVRPLLLPFLPSTNQLALTYSGGITAPLIGGPLVAVSPTLAVITSVIIFLLSAILLFLLDRALVRAASTTATDTEEGGPLRAYAPIRVEGE